MIRPTLSLLALLLLTPSLAPAQEIPPEDWIQLFAGESLEGWTPKLAGHPLGDDPLRTFGVEDGRIKVSYDRYDSFDNDFGHLFYERELSYYVVAVEYRFVGEQAPNGPAWALRNSGIMIHAQAPETMTVDQDFPISLEAQFLGGNGSDRRPTANLCTPGTHVEIDDELATTHCIESSSKTVHGDQWVRVELTVLGNERIEHRVDGETVLVYSKPQIGGGVVNSFDPEVKQDGMSLDRGYLALQSESHPIEVRKVELVDLIGCMDRQSPSYRDYFVVDDPARCVAP